MDTINDVWYVPSDKPAYKQSAINGAIERLESGYNFRVLNGFIVTNVVYYSYGGKPCYHVTVRGF